MPTPAAQALMDAKATLDAERAKSPELRAATVAAQTAEDTQNQVIQAAVLAYDAALNALLVESGNMPEQ